MAYDTTWSFPNQADANEDWILSCDSTGGGGTDHEAATADNTNGGWWCWTATGSPSSGTGPPSGTDCIYSETSTSGTGQPAAGDTFTCELRTAINASLYELYVTFDRCTQGNTAGTLYVDAWDGSDWNNLDSFAGDSTTTFTSEGPYDVSAYTNTDFKIRFRVVLGSTTVYTHDFSITNIRIYGADAASIEQEGYRFYNDGTESGSTARQLQDVVDSITRLLTFQLRIILNATGDPPTQQYQLEYKEASDPATEWRKVPLT